MRHNVFALTLGVALLWTLPDVVSAQGLDVQKNRYEPTMIVDARPLEAQVLIDGRPIGSAGALAARAIPVTPGPHIVEITAAGYHPYVREFTANITGASQFVVTLAPQ